MTERLRILVHISNYFQSLEILVERISPIRMSLTSYVTTLVFHVETTGTGPKHPNDIYLLYQGVHLSIGVASHEQASGALFVSYSSASWCRERRLFFHHNNTFRAKLTNPPNSSSSSSSSIPTTTRRKLFTTLYPRNGNK